MLNLTRFTSSYTVAIKCVSKDVHKWTEDGEGEYVCTHTPDWINETADMTEEQLKNELASFILGAINKYKTRPIEEEDLFLGEDGLIQYNQLEDKEANEDEDGEYLADYTVEVSINGLDLTGEELKEVFPNAED